MKSQGRVYEISYWSRLEKRFEETARAKGILPGTFAYYGHSMQLTPEEAKEFMGEFEFDPEAVKAGLELSYQAGVQLNKILEEAGL